MRELTVEDDETERAFLDANVIRGQLTNDILLSLAEQDLLNPRWSQTVLDEMRRNRPAGVSEQRLQSAVDGTQCDARRAPVGVPQSEASGANWPGCVSPADHGR